MGQLHTADVPHYHYHTVPCALTHIPPPLCWCSSRTLPPQRPHLCLPSLMPALQTWAPFSATTLHTPAHTLLCYTHVADGDGWLWRFRPAYLTLHHQTGRAGCGPTTAHLYLHGLLAGCSLFALPTALNTVTPSSRTLCLQKQAMPTPHYPPPHQPYGISGGPPPVARTRTFPVAFGWTHGCTRPPPAHVAGWIAHPFPPPHPTGHGSLQVGLTTTATHTYLSWIPCLDVLYSWLVAHTATHTYTFLLLGGRRSILSTVNGTTRSSSERTDRRDVVTGRELTAHLDAQAAAPTTTAPARTGPLHHLLVCWNDMPATGGRLNRCAWAAD